MSDTPPFSKANHYAAGHRSAMTVSVSCKVIADDGQWVAMNNGLGQAITGEGETQLEAVANFYDNVAESYRDIDE